MKFVTNYGLIGYISQRLFHKLQLLFVRAWELELNNDLLDPLSSHFVGHFKQLLILGIVSSEGQFRSEMPHLRPIIAHTEATKDVAPAKKPLDIYCQ